MNLVTRISASEIFFLHFEGFPSISYWDISWAAACKLRGPDEEQQDSLPNDIDSNIRWQEVLFAEWKCWPSTKDVLSYNTEESWRLILRPRIHRSVKLILYQMTKWGVLSSTARSRFLCDSVCGPSTQKPRGWYREGYTYYGMHCKPYCAEQNQDIYSEESKLIMMIV